MSVKTLQYGQREGRLIAVARTDGNRRVYRQAQIREFIGLRNAVSEPTRLLAYRRLSRAAQKPHLAHQRKVLEEFVVAKGLANVEFIEEAGGGLDFRRKRFFEIPDAMGRGKAKALIPAHRDRPSRFGFERFEHFPRINGCERLVLNQQRLSPARKMVQDRMTPVQSLASVRHAELPKRAGRGAEEGRRT